MVHHCGNGLLRDELFLFFPLFSFFLILKIALGISNPDKVWPRSTFLQKWIYQFLENEICRAGQDISLYKIKGKRAFPSHSTLRRQPWRHFSLYCNIVERIGFSPKTRATLRRPMLADGQQMYPCPEMEERSVVGNCHYSTVSLSKFPRGWEMMDGKDL